MVPECVHSHSEVHPCSSRKPLGKGFLIPQTYDSETWEPFLNLEKITVIVCFSKKVLGQDSSLLTISQHLIHKIKYVHELRILIKL